MSKKLTIEEHAFIMASGEYLTEHVPDNFEDMDDDDFNEFINQNAWEGVENLDAKEIISQIRQTADLMIRFRDMEFEL